MQYRKYGGAALLVGLVAATGTAVAQPIGDGWLLGAPDDATRFRLLQTDAGGMGRTMFEMSVRFERLYQHVADGDLEVAAHVWSSIRGSLRSGIVRRPDRADTANAFILDTLYDRVTAEFESGDIARARVAFMEVRSACMACHQANDLAYLNEQRLFRDLIFN